MKYLILGAGPAGLSLANRLKQLGEDSFLVLEKEETAGGLCRSVWVDGAPFDIGGGHFLDVKNHEVNNFLFSFMPQEEWNLFERDSQIQLENNRINSPIESNIWQMDLYTQVEYLKAIAVAGCNLGKKMPEKFVDWIFWKLGDRIAQDYMLPYNKKMFADELNELGTYWLEKLPNVSFEETLLSCLTHKAYGTQPAHTTFFYPAKYGYGELWLRMAEKIKDHIVYKTRVEELDFDSRVIKTTEGTSFRAQVIITTVPWRAWKALIGMPSKLQSRVKNLKHSSIETRYFPQNIETTAHWIYYPDTKLPYHRILVRHNFCPQSRGGWMETRKERITMFSKEEIPFSYINEYAYPLNTLQKPEIMKELLEWCKKKNVYGLGRWGEHQHYNSDVTVGLALKLAEKLCKETR